MSSLFNFAKAHEVLTRRNFDFEGFLEGQHREGSKAQPLSFVYRFPVYIFDAPLARRNASQIFEGLTVTTDMQSESARVGGLETSIDKYVFSNALVEIETVFPIGTRSCHTLRVRVTVLVNGGPVSMDDI